MAALVIRNMPADLHRRLKKEAARNRRSMTQQALVMLEESMAAAQGGVLRPSEVPPAATLAHPVKGKVLMTQAMLTRAIRKGRA